MFLWGVERRPVSGARSDGTAAFPTRAAIGPQRPLAFCTQSYSLWRPADWSRLNVAIRYPLCDVALFDFAASG